MGSSNVEIVRELLDHSMDERVVNRLMAPDSIYMSLTFDNSELRRLMPWAGVHQDGRAGVLYTFRTLNEFWTIPEFRVIDAFGSGDDVAVFGSFTVHSKRLDKTFRSPFSVHAKVKDGQVTYLQYMEDTFGTGSTFRAKGVWTFAGDPSGATVEVGE